MDKVRVLIVNADRQCGERLERAVSSWGMMVKSLTNLRFVIQDILRHNYHIIVFDICMLDTADIDLLTRLRVSCPKTKVILITGHEDREITMQALRMGAFGCVEKPLDLDRLQHTIQQAVNILALEQKNLELMELHESFSKFAKTIERVRIATEMSIKNHMRTLLTPIMQKIKSKESFETYEIQLNMLANYIESLISEPVKLLQDNILLSSRELNIALMIKGGMTDQEIAEHLHISYETVKVHRRNIRKKLGITGKRNKLSAYLQTVNGDCEDITYVRSQPSTAIDADIYLGDRSLS